MGLDFGSAITTRNYECILTEEALQRWLDKLSSAKLVCFDTETTSLDPMMADVELSRGFPLFYRDPDANTYGVLNVREAFAAEHPDLVQKVLKVYERGRQWALQNPEALAKLLATTAKLPEPVAAKQLARTQFVEPRPGDAQRAALVAAGEALQQAGIIKPEVDIKGTVDTLLEPSFATSVAAAP